MNNKGNVVAAMQQALKDMTQSNVWSGIIRYEELIINMPQTTVCVEQLTN